MKKIIFFIAFQSFLGVLFLNAQPGYNPNRPSIREHNRYSNCSEPFAETRFNRDFPALANASLRYRDYEIRSYIRYKCLTSDQMRRLALLYATDRERERFLMYAFNFVFDLQDFSITATSLMTVPTRNDFYQFLASKGIPTGDLVYVYPPNYYPQNGTYNNGYPPPANGTYGNYPPQNGNYPPPPPANNGNNNYPPQTNNGNYPQQQPNGNAIPPPANNGNNNYPPQNNNGNYPQQQPNSNGNYPPPVNNGNNNNYPPQNNNGNYSPSNRPMMSYATYETLKTQLSQKAFEKDRIELANQTVTQNFLTSDQIAGVMKTFAYDNNRLDFAKYAYTYVYDKENYGVVLEALSFDSNKKTMKEFLTKSATAANH